jgi:fluoride exporter
MFTILEVALGGAIGSVLRYLTNLSAFRFFGPSFPIGTFAVNVIGSLVMGFLFVGLADKTRTAPFLMTGVLGGFTTFSAFSLDALKLFESDRISSAALYIFGSVTVSLLAVFIGATIARTISS